LKRKFVSFFVLLFLVLIAWMPVYAEEAKKEVSAWQKANQLYQDKDYEGAIEAYKEVLKEDTKDSAVYYNLGNAYYKTGKIGYAVLNYEKALHLNPRSKEIRENLKFAESHIPFKIGDSTPAVLKWFIDKSRYFRKDEVIAVALVLYTALLIIFIFRLLRRGGNWLFRIRRLLLILFLLSLILVGLRFYDLRHEDAILIQPQVEARYGPSLHEGSAFRLTDGIPVKVVDKIGNWYRVELSNGETGWVEKSSVGII
jgi:tetratricopeptide (TPR) repeat protein